MTDPTNLMILGVDMVKKDIFGVIRTEFVLEKIPFSYVPAILRNTMDTTFKNKYSGISLDDLNDLNAPTTKMSLFSVDNSKTELDVGISTDTFIFYLLIPENWIFDLKNQSRTEAPIYRMGGTANDADCSKIIYDDRYNESKFAGMHVIKSTKDTYHKFDFHVTINHISGRPVPIIIDPKVRND